MWYPSIKIEEYMMYTGYYNYELGFCPFALFPSAKTCQNINFASIFSQTSFLFSLILRLLSWYMNYKNYGMVCCYSCGIVGESVVTFISTLPVLLVLIINSVLYTVTWKHIRIAGRRATGESSLRFIISLFTRS